MCDMYTKCKRTVEVRPETNISSIQDDY